MKKFLIVFLMIVILTNSVLATSYNITNWDELNATRNDLAGDYLLQNDLNSLTTGYSNYQTGAGFLPISTFTGTFDGQNYTIDGLYINRPTTNNVGLFGYTNGAEISNVGLTNVNVSGKYRVGGLVGYSTSYSSIDNSYSIGNVNGTEYVGGLVGFNVYYSSIDNSYSIGNVNGTTQVGGLVGYSYYSPINNSYSTGNVNGASYVGGLVGASTSYSSIDNSYSTGNVNGTDRVGGLVGYSYYSPIDNSYSTGNVNGREYVGGLVGYSYQSSIDNSYSTGNVNGTDYVGGIVGSTYTSSVNNSYSIGNVNGTDYIGGLVGSATYSSSIDNSYSTGNVNGTTLVGGLVGYNGYSSVNNSYSTGNVTGISSVGGLVGDDFYSSIGNSYSIGNVNGTDRVGGLVGSTYTSSVNNSYSTGNVNGASYVGGLVGDDYISSIINSFWYNSTANSDLNCYDGGNTGCTAVDNEEYFFNYSNAPMDVWDFTNVWSDVLEFSDYPIFISQSEPYVANPIIMSLISSFFGTTFYLTRQGDLGIGNIFPLNNNLYSLGSSTLRWTKGWFNDLDTNKATIGNLIVENVTTTNLNVTDKGTVTNHLQVLGNFSAKRPYLNAHTNISLTNPSTSATNIMNITNIEDNYYINVQGNQNITFSQTGDYLCIVSPQFTNTAVTAQVGFWFQKTNSSGTFVDSSWTNSRYTIGNGEYNAPAIPFQFDINNTTNDKVRFMWYSTSTNTRLEAITGLTTPTRPAVPSIILNCQKVSEIT